MKMKFGETKFRILFLIFSKFILSINTYITINNNHFIDEYNRTKIFHGINLINKKEPYYPILSGNQIQDLVNNGFNVVRLGCLWIGFEPTRYQYNYTYLSEIEDIIKRFQKYDIYVIIDNHQDLLSSRFKGDGFPEWLLPKNDTLPFPEPLSCIECNWGDYYFTNAVSSAFQNLYDNYDDYQDSLSHYLTIVSELFKNYTNVIGYELINEPWMGNIYDNPKLFLEYGFADRSNLEPMYIKLSTAIRKVNTEQLIFFEPVTWDYLQVGFNRRPDPKSVLSYHIYCLDYSNNMSKTKWEICNITSLDMIMFRYQDIHRLSVAGFMTEFGDVSNDQDGTFEIGNMTYYANELHQSWTYWGDYQDPLINEVLTSIYPMSISGELVKYQNYGNGNGNDFIIEYYTDPMIVEPTVIYVSTKKIRVHLEPIGIVGYQRKGNYLNLYNVNPGLVTITIKELN